jgi:glc operon protein GlcG
MSKIIDKKSLTLSSANQLIELAIKKAGELGVGGAIAVVDDGGHLIGLSRIDGTMAAAADIAIGKAATAVVFKRPGHVLERTITEDRPAMMAFSGMSSLRFVPLKGSYPIVMDGMMVGAIAVAGAVNGENDEAIALYAIDNFLK